MRQKSTKYSQSINSVSKLSVLAKHVLKFIAESFIDLTESVFKSNFTEFVADRLRMREPRTGCWGAALSRLFILFVDALLIMIYEAKLFHLQHQTRISLSINAGKVYLKIIHNLRFIFRLHSSECHYFELMLFIYWQSREQILWIIRCPRVQYLHKWFSLFQSENKQQQPFEGRKNVESLINIEFFVCVRKWTISQQTLVYSIDVPLSPKINSLEWQTNFKWYIWGARATAMDKITWKTASAEKNYNLDLFI